MRAHTHVLIGQLWNAIIFIYQWLFLQLLLLPLPITTQNGTKVFFLFLGTDFNFLPQNSLNELNLNLSSYTYTIKSWADRTNFSELCHYVCTTPIFFINILIKLLSLLRIFRKVVKLVGYSSGWVENDQGSIVGVCGFKS